MSAAPARLWHVVPALGVTQIIGWGSLYYSISVLASAMAASLDCSCSWIFGAFSVSLATSGLAAPAAGRAIDRLGGRAVLCAGSLLAALALALIALAPSLPWFFAGWLLAGIAMACCLYDAAFPALSQLAGAHYRRALTALTLFGGLASTAFWPLAWQLERSFDWRTALLSFAALHLLLCFPLHRWVLPKIPPKPPRTDSTSEPARPGLSPTLRRSLILLAAAFTLNAFVFSGIGAHVVGALSAATGEATQAVWIASLIGPLQVTGRILEFSVARRLSARMVGLTCFALTTLAMFLLWQAAELSVLALLFVIIYGAANGVMTIVRGTVPVELFGREQFGRINGQIAAPAFFAKACAPMLIALLLDQGGRYTQMALVLAVISAAAFVFYLKANQGLDRSDS
ncbi:MFS transporter [Uliginosibacterium flavum]|uniref:MFS transporter n=1 Tax=Uliginosibacterium flavum TaxID=1396831 RepID=A0ABV2TP09_9RHOO